MSEPNDDANPGSTPPADDPPAPPWAVAQPPPAFGRPPSPPGVPPGFGDVPTAPGVPPGFGGPGAGGAGSGVPGAAPAPSVPPRPPASHARPTRSKLPWIAAVVVVLVIAGIVAVVARGASDEHDTSSSRSPEGTVEAFSEAIETGDADTFCELLSDAQQDVIARGLGRRCVDSVGPILALAGSIGAVDIDVTGSAVHGHRATVSVLANGSASEIPLVQEHGRWVIDTSPDALIGGDATTEGPADMDGTEGSGGSRATSAACTAELQTVQIAVEAYRASVGHDPADAQALVDEGLLRELPTRATVTTDGTVTPAGDCD